MSLKSNTSIVILGGGVTGLSTAYHIARTSGYHVTVIDKGPVGDGSSSRAAAIITGHIWSKTGVLARKTSLALFREFSNELEGYQFQATGTLNLFDKESWKDREPLLPLYTSLNVPYEILNADEMKARWPQLHPEASMIGLFDPLGGYSEPDDYIPALAKKCRELGVEIREHVRVTEIIERAGKVVGVNTVDGRIEADAVVSTVYAWTNAFLAQREMALPIKSFVHQRFVTAPFSPPPQIPAVNANPLYGYVRPHKSGGILFGFETHEREEFVVEDTNFHMNSLTIPASLREQARNSLKSLVPALNDIEWQSEKVGLINFSSDGEPILGPIPQIEGLYVGLAFHSGGFAYNPVTGKFLAEYVTKGQPSQDLSAFAPNRFNPDETKSYLQELVPQKSAVRRRH